MNLNELQNLATKARNLADCINALLVAFKDLDSIEKNRHLIIEHDKTLLKKKSHMSASARKAASIRMKKYWRDKRKQKRS